MSLARFSSLWKQENKKFMKTHQIKITAMKTRTILISIMMAFSLVMFGQSENKIRLTTAPGLEQLASDLATIYKSVNPMIEFDLNTKEDGVSAQSLNLVYTDNLRKQSDEYAWQLLVGRDAIVPVVNKANPMYNEYMEKGISFQTINEMISSGSSDICFADVNVLDGLSDYLNIQSIGMTLKPFNSKNDFLSNIENKNNIIGFCMLSDLLKAEQIFNEGFALLPIDRNNNGRIESSEDFYGSVETFANALWVGKYPKQLGRNIHIVSSENEISELENEFLTWIHASGQEVLASNGFIALTSHEKLAAVRNLNAPELKTVTEENDNAWIILLVVSIGAFILFGLLLTWLFRDRSQSAETDALREDGVFNLSSVEAPKGLMYDKSHTWAFMENNGNVAIGMDDFLHHIIGPVSRIKTLAKGEKVNKGEAVATIIQGGKQITLNSPVSGTIVAINKAAVETGDENSFVESWIYKIEPSNWKREMDFMFMADQYKVWIKSEFTRLKDFIAKALQASSPQYAQIVLQDGGELREGFMTELEPEVWEDFQNEFLNKLS
jgi:glycine cleavage system H lipoate-binding protein